VITESRPICTSPALHTAPTSFTLFPKANALVACSVPVTTASESIFMLPPARSTMRPAASTRSAAPRSIVNALPSCTSRRTRTSRTAGAVPGSTTRRANDCTWIDSNS
jgi:hypothetical protein